MVVSTAVPDRACTGVLAAVSNRFKHQGVTHIDADPLPSQGLNLLKEAWQVDDHSIPHHAHGLLVQDARGHQVQGKFGALVIVDGVPSIGASLHSKQTSEGHLAKTQGGARPLLPACLMEGMSPLLRSRSHDADYSRVAQSKSSQNVNNPYSARRL